MKEKKFNMSNKENISNTFLALNYINLSKDFTRNQEASVLTVREIWDVVLNPHKYQNEINNLLENNTFSKIFFKIMEKECVFYQSKLVAAASEEVLVRTSNDFKIEIIKSNKDNSSFYLILTLLKEFELPLLNLYVFCNGKSVSKRISPFNNKQVQMLVKKDEKFYRLFTNPESEIFIR